MEIGNKLPIMFNNMEEVEFLRSCLNPDFDVLEWGSGGSTLEIARHVKSVESIEHDLGWFEKVKSLAPSNVHIHYVPRNREEAPGHDGTFEDYFYYISRPIGIFPIGVSSAESRYDLIFIDGRARVECAKVALKVLKPGGVILIHDYRNPNENFRRYEYEVVEEFLDRIDGAYALWKFKPKQNG